MCKHNIFNIVSPSTSMSVNFMQHTYTSSHTLQPMYTCILYTYLVPAPTRGACSRCSHCPGACRSNENRKRNFNNKNFHAAAGAASDGHIVLTMDFCTLHAISLPISALFYFLQSNCHHVCSSALLSPFISIVVDFALCKR